MGTLLQDVRYAARTLLKAPAFALIVISTLALGIGANTAIFTLMDQVLLRALPVRAPQDLVIVDFEGRNMGRVEGDKTFSYPMLQDLRQAQSVSGILGRAPVPATLMVENRSERVRAEMVSGNYFEVLGVPAASGRVFARSDETTPDGHPVVVLTHAFWTRRFGGNPDVVGRTIRINGMSMTVVGVAPRGFNGIDLGYAVDVFVPLMMRSLMVPTAPRDSLHERRWMWLQLMARPREDQSRERMTAELTTIFRRARAEELKTIPIQSPSFRKGFAESYIVLLPGYKGIAQIREQFSTPMLVLMGMVCLVLLIACANVANLLMARAPSRQREIAVRLALGASRRRVVTQLLVESLVLALAGGALGVLLAVWGADLLVRALPFEAASLTLSSTPDARVLLFTLAVTLLTGLLFGLVPALQMARPQLVHALKEEGGTVVSAGHLRLRKGLVVAQVALSLLLLVGAGLFARSLWNLRALDPGFRVDRLFTFSLDPALSGYSAEASTAFYERLRQRLAQEPGVSAVSMTGIVPLTNSQWNATVRVLGYESKEGEDLNLSMNIVGPDYFRTMGVPILVGRDIQPSDAATTPKVAVINEKTARYFFGHQNPVGRRFGVGGKNDDFEIVGVARDGKDSDLRREVSRAFYLPSAQFSEVGQMTMLVRVDGASITADSLRNAVRQVDPLIPVFDLRPMSAITDESLFIDRMFALLSAGFGFLAMILAAIGLYGVMSYAVARRTREIGVRMALGADPRGVVWLVMREVAALAVIGVGIGLPASIAVARLVSSQLYGVAPSDPLTLSLSTVILLTVALLAGYVPAGNATRIDPIRALRWE